MILVIVRFSKNLQREGKSPSTLKADISVLPRFEGLEVEPGGASLAQYILDHPIPDSWEVQRTVDATNSFSDGVYFLDNKTKQPTPVLWIDPLFHQVKDGELIPLPLGWTRSVLHGTIVYKDSHGRISVLPPFDRSRDDARTFSSVLAVISFSVLAKFDVE
jgi:hypothetical protein